MGITSKTSLLLFLIFISFSCFQASAAAVIGIDFGTLFYKTTLVKPGKSLYVVDNDQSKRKTPTCVAITPARLFQFDAYRSLASKPESSFSFLSQTLGLEFNSTEFQNHIQEFRLTHIPWIETENRHTVSVKANENYTVEELTAMILRTAKTLAERSAEESIKDCVLTVPPYLDNAQRLALKKSLEIANLNPLSFLNENLAASIKYVIDGTHNTSGKPYSIVLYVNVGASSFKVSVLNHSRDMDPETLKPADKIEVLGEHWDETLGGRHFDFVVADIIANKFNSLPQRKGKSDVRKSIKAMAKILERAADVKEKLSASKYVKVIFENLLDYVSYSGDIQRTEFEEKLEMYKKRIEHGIQSALNDAKITLGEIDEIELLGGGQRVPKIQEMIQSAVKEKRVSQRLNPDEAMSFGAGFVAAGLSRAYRVKPMILVGKAPYQINIFIGNLHEVCASNNMESTTPCSKSALSYKKPLVKKGDRLDKAKTVNIPFGSDLKLVLYEQKTEDSKSEKAILQINVTGIQDWYTKYQNEPNVTLKTALTFSFDELGIIDLTSAKLIEKRAISKIVTGNAGNDSQGNTSNKTEGKTITEQLEEKHPLEVSRIQLGVKQMTTEEVNQAKLRIDLMEQKEREARAYGEAKNNYESAIYSARDWLKEPKNEPFCTPDQRTTLLELLDKDESWIYASEENKPDKAEFVQKATSLAQNMNELKRRKKEYENFPDYMSELKGVSKNASQAISDLSKNHTWLKTSDIKPAKEKLEELEHWIIERQEERAKMPLTSDPVLTRSLVDSHISGLKAKIKSLRKIEKPKERTKKVCMKSVSPLDEWDKCFRGMREN